jgi:hypothetical protein
MTVAATTTIAALVLCGVGLAVQVDAATVGVQDLANMLALRNAPLCICALAWGVLIADTEGGYPAAKVQYATLILFFGTAVGVFSSLRSVGDGIMLAQRVLSL